jgi:hypothetical protein
MGLFLAKQYNKYEEFNVVYIKKIASSTPSIQEPVEKEKDVPVETFSKNPDSNVLDSRKINYADSGHLHN